MLLVLSQHGLALRLPEIFPSSPHRGNCLSAGYRAAIGGKSALPL
jgi:hypothetical protein